MSQRRASVLAWSLAGLSMILYNVNVALYVLAHPARPSSTISTSLAGALFLIFPVVGALIAARRPGNPTGGVLLAHGLLWIVSDTAGYYADYGVANPSSVPFPVRSRRHNQLAVGTLRGPARDLRLPAVPRRTSAIQEMAPPGLAVRVGASAG